MERSGACEELVRLILGGAFQYEEEAALALQIFIGALEEGDDPAMALALAKNLNYTIDFGQVTQRNGGCTV